MMNVLPVVAKVQRSVNGVPGVDVKEETAKQLESLLSSSTLKAGETVAVAVGSRGIANLSTVVDQICQQLKNRGAVPVIVPAMGSHGGASPQGQENVLNALGIDSAKLEVSIDASMETVCLGETNQGVPVHFSQAALQADHLLVCNRIKPHTSFNGSVQSGIQKMLTIGLGKEKGATAYHRASHSVSFDQMVKEAVEVITEKLSFLGGLALLENSSKQLAKIKAVTRTKLAETEYELLKKAEGLMARLPMQQIDLLIIDEIGKEISGTGLDTNIVGRKYNDHVSTTQDWCQTRFIYVRSLSEKTQGNATGIGIAEFCSEKLCSKVDWQKTTINSIAAGHPTAAMRPVVYSSDRDVVNAVFGILGEQARIVQIQNTLRLNQLIVSETCLEELTSLEPDAQISALTPIEFDSSGQLPETSLNFS